MSKRRFRPSSIQGTVARAKFTLPYPLCIAAAQTSSDSTESPQPTSAFTSQDQLFTNLSEAAQHWFGFGFKLLPILPRQKIPATAWDAWMAKLSQISIEAYWDKYPDHEIACLVGDEFIVFDADTQQAEDALLALEARFGMSSQLVIKTRKGIHHYFQRALGSRARSDSHSTEKYPERIDVKTGRSLAMLPCSTDKVIAFCNVKHASELSTASQEFMDAVCIHNGRTPPQPLAILPDDEISACADGKASNVEITKLEKLVASLDPNMGYDDWTHVLMAIHYETGGSDAGLALADRWSSKGDTYKGIKEIETKWRSFKADAPTQHKMGSLIWWARNAGVDTNAIMHPVEAFEFCETETIYQVAPAPSRETLRDDPAASHSPNAIKRQSVAANDSSKKSKTNPALAEVQNQFALINMNGKVCVFDQVALSTLTLQGTAPKLALSNRSDGALLIMRALTAGCTDPDADHKKVLAQFWVSPQTVCYAGVDFRPNGLPDNYLNLWVGPTIVPMVGRWALIQAFLLEIICGGNQTYYVYLISYIAHALQRPEEKPGVMINLLGGQGIGKGTLARILQLIWSATFLQVSNVDAVTGSFNASLERAFIVFMDEALFAGDRRASDALKSLVTEPVIYINEKHQPARQTNSYHRFFAATNADHLKNTERDDRRDFSLRVSEARKGDHAYWTALNDEIQNGGIQAMVHDLQAMDLSGFNVRAKPDTQELLEQKLQSLEPIPRWWHSCLVDGELGEDDVWPDFVATDAAIASVMDFTGGKLFRKPSAQDIVKALKKLCPSAVPGQKETGLGRKRGLELPPLEMARSDFERYIGAAVAW